MQRSIDMMRRSGAVEVRPFVMSHDAAADVVAAAGRARDRVFGKTEVKTYDISGMMEREQDALDAYASDVGGE